MKKLFFIFLLLMFSAQLFPQKKAFTIADLYRVKNLGSLSVSPDGKTLLFTLTESKLAEGTTNADIYIMGTDGANIKNISNTPKSESNPVWGSDGKFIYYTSPASGETQVYKLNPTDLNSEKITDFNMGVSDFRLSPDMKTIAFSSDVYPECGADNQRNKINSEASDNGPLQANMADELLFRHWTAYSGGKVSHVLLFNTATKEYADLTPGKYNCPTFMLAGSDGFNFSPEGDEICYFSKKVKDQACSTNSDLFTVSIDGKGTKNLTDKNQAWDGTPKYSPDGKYIAYRLQLIPAFEADKFRLAVYDRKKEKTSILTEKFDYWVEDFQWSADSKTIYFTAEVGGYVPLYKIDIESLKIDKLSPDVTIGSFDVARDQKFAYYICRLVDKPTEIYRLDLASKDVKRISSFNDDLINEVDFRPAEQIWVPGADGKMIHVFIVKPHNFDPNKKYPLIFNVHGGPQSQWADALRGDWQVYPGAGYVVAFCNPHGSTGYGQSFTDAISGDWNGKVFTDLMKVTDSLEKLPYINKDKIGAMGWSYGGYMMNWFQASTKRYKCLASMMGIYNLESMYGATEELWFVEWDLKGQPWNSELYKKMSPSNYVKNFSTPTLIITGEKDYRVPYTQSLEYFTALQKLGIDSRIIIFKNDGHWPSGVKSMPFYYNAHLDWFHKYLGGEPAPYDMDKMIKNRVFEVKK
jgi:dipeptidyl aminopeptidase/acylaminoacyl peptidase